MPGRLCTAAWRPLLRRLGLKGVVVAVADGGGDAVPWTGDAKDPPEAAA